ncbi:P protein-like [Teleopsis dalmanni]|uniref:P protein-like n=1 Tax=Teleopsis dalmanni TaxID=139649 RepID=UPI0018CF01D4|nr:P protein-like [Teleopsis dalmanni]
MEETHPEENEFVDFSIEALKNSLRFTTESIRSEGGAGLERGSTESAIEDIDADEDVEEDVRTSDKPYKRKLRKILRWLKICLLVLYWVLFTALLWKQPDVVLSNAVIYVPENSTRDFYMPKGSGDDAVEVVVRGPFQKHSKEREEDLEDTEHILTIGVMYLNDESEIVSVSDEWYLEIVKAELIESAPVQKRMHVFALHSEIHGKKGQLLIRFETKLKLPLPLSLQYQSNAVGVNVGVMCAGGILLFTTILLFTQPLNRTLTAMISSTMAIGVLAYFHKRPSLEFIMEWIDVETMMLIFSMGIIVGIFAETGIHDYLALWAYKLSNGHIWPLINCTCLLLLFSNLCWDSVTTVMLICPIVLRLTELMQLNPLPFLKCVIIVTNLSGAIMPYGVNSGGFKSEKEFFEEMGITELTFIAHLLVGILLAMAVSYMYLRIMFINSAKMQFKENAEVERLRRVIKLMKHTAKGISEYSKDESAMKSVVINKVHTLRHQLRRLGKMPQPPKNYEEILESYQTKYRIHNNVLLAQCCCVLFFVMALSLSRFAQNFYLTVGWTTMLGAILILILIDREDLESILHRIEWTTIIFFAAFFVFTRALSMMGLFDFLQIRTQQTIMNLDEEHRLWVSILILLWVSGLGSAILNNKPVSTMLNH